MCVSIQRPVICKFEHVVSWSGRDVGAVRDFNNFYPQTS